ncbi:MAG: hypothetical protein HHJ12_04635 [Glaciimonas sp.]|nr:hypothetical protein [Glaciimonas sp.]
MEQYKDAAIRHYRDAVVLLDADKLDNAGHLVGFSAECAIKHAIASLRLTAGSPKGHFPEFLGIARKHLDKRSSMYDLLQQDLLSGWRVDRRYHATGETSSAELDTWFQNTKRLLGSAGIKERK